MRSAKHNTAGETAGEKDEFGVSTHEFNSAVRMLKDKVYQKGKTSICMHFQALDLDRSGQLELGEFRKAIKAFNLGLSDSVRAQHPMPAPPFGTAPPGYQLPTSVGMGGMMSSKPVKVEGRILGRNAAPVALCVCRAGFGGVVVGQVGHFGAGHDEGGKVGHKKGSERICSCWVVCGASCRGSLRSVDNAEGG